MIARAGLEQRSITTASCLWEEVSGEGKDAGDEAVTPGSCVLSHLWADPAP